MLNMKCKLCGQTLRRLMLLAMIQDAGASVSPSALACKHEFKDNAHEEAVKDVKDDG